MITKLNKNNQAFTIVELLIVIVVIGILAAITIVAYNGIQNRARTTTLKSDLRQAQTQLELARVDTSSYPSNDSKLNKSPDTYFEYDSLNSGNGYCLTATHTATDAGAYHISSTTGTIQEGPCSGHSGTAPGVGGGGVALSCPTGFIPVPGNSLFNQDDFCVMKYQAKNDGDSAVSRAADTPWVSISQTNAMAAAQTACDGCGLITEAQWLTIAHNVLNVNSNWTGGSVGSGQLYRGHSDDAPTSTLAASSDDSNGYYGTGNSGSSEQRRTHFLSNGEVIWDLAGNVWEWTTGQTSGGRPGASGIAWRDWNAVEGTGDLSPSPFPAFGTPVASNWTHSQSIGMLYSDSSQTTTIHGFRRGGSRISNAGVFTLALSQVPSTSASNLGFRATLEP